jgi:DNA-binding beta-propeller fold protein YncE
VDAAGNLFIADTYHDCIRKVSPDGIITTVAGTGGRGKFFGDGGPATGAGLHEPFGVAVDAAGNLFIGDFNNHRVRKVSPEGTITTVAGNGQSGHSGDGGPATRARLWPQGVAVDPLGNLFIADWEYENGRIRKVDPAGIITTVAGGGRPADRRGDGGLATNARLAWAGGPALDAKGNLFIPDFVDNRVRMVRPDGTILTVAGGGQPADGLGDGGPATNARLAGPFTVVVDAGGNLFIADLIGERVRKVSPAGIITTVAGTGQIGFTGDGGPALAARLNSPHGLALDRAGNLLFAEGTRRKPPYGYPDRLGNSLVRKVIGVAVPQ